VLENPRAKEPALRAALSAIEATGAPQQVELRITQLAEQALSELEHGLSPAGRELLNRGDGGALATSHMSEKARTEPGVGRGQRQDRAAR